MTGKSHADKDIGEAFGLEVMQKLNDKCEEWKRAENVGYSLYGSPEINLRFYGTFTSDGEIKVA